jgi:hypothetical protein
LTRRCSPPETEDPLRGTAREASGRRSGRDGRYPLRLSPPESNPPADDPPDEPEEDDPPDEPEEDEPPVEPPPEGRETAEPLLPPPEFGRAPAALPDD